MRNFVTGGLLPRTAHIAQNSQKQGLIQQTIQKKTISDFPLDNPMSSLPDSLSLLVVSALCRAHQ